ncbi:hypothetical protein QTJ16_006407 [Diplocarpon rosae]|uniref:Uncharacterized protein n=1 Tax=Diplocarpon rosae TaxID=946125 RepID=A0AAD9SWS5_9HELO|nr:hypothetical protein QTJ16_006407 [Diplocarpon rosae]
MAVRGRSLGFVQGRIEKMTPARPAGDAESQKMRLRGSRVFREKVCPTRETLERQRYGTFRLSNPQSLANTQLSLSLSLSLSLAPFS